MDPNAIPLTSFRDPTEEQVRAKPWRYIGYRRFSEWSASDNDSFVVRLFGTLATRVILRMQWEISELETQLSEIDNECMFENPKDMNNGAFRWDSEDRKEVLDRLVQKLKQYCESALHGKWVTRPLSAN